MERLVSFFRDEEGATAVEYAVMLALILLVALVAIKTFGQQASEMWAGDTSQIGDALNNAGGS